MLLLYHHVSVEGNSPTAHCYFASCIISGSGSCIKHSQFKCTVRGAACIEQKYVLDNIRDCADGSEECECRIDSNSFPMNDRNSDSPCDVFLGSNNSQAIKASGIHFNYIVIKKIEIKIIVSQHFSIILQIISLLYHLKTCLSMAFRLYWIRKKICVSTKEGPLNPGQGVGIVNGYGYATTTLKDKV